MNIQLFKENAELYISNRLSPPVMKNRFLGYTKTVDTATYSIYELAKRGVKVVAAYGSMLLLQKGTDETKLTLYPYYQNRSVKRVIKLNNRTFPGLLPGSRILKCCFIPFMRTVGKDRYVKSVRLNIITDKAQIYHNFPARSKDCDGNPMAGDITRFEESVIWDIPGRKYPVRENSSKTYERYYPNLPAECYLYHPIPCTDISFSDKYHNGGFGKSTCVMSNGEETEVSRFYIPIRQEKGNPFHFIGGGEDNIKMKIIATYRSNVDVGVRICVFASSDGGRQWYCKYEFADWGEYRFQQGHTGDWGRNFGNAIINSSFNQSFQGGVSVLKRELVFPCSENSTPAEKFKWTSAGKVTAVSGGEQLVLCTDVPHGLTTGNIIALTGTEDKVGTLSWMLNNDTNPCSAGNGLLFKVEAISETELRLFELVSSPDNNIPCRHIHHVNRIKDGWLIGTGELYPNGWLYYISMRESDSYSIVNARDELQFVRLNSTDKSVQRTMGGYLSEADSSELLYASDHDTLEMHAFSPSYDNQKRVLRGSTGVYRIPLARIDHREESTLVYGAYEPCFYFQKLNGVYVFCGQRGELAMSFDNGESWKTEHLDESIIHYRGSVGHLHCFDSVIIFLK